MTIKEKPFIDAVSNVGALPGFLTANATGAGLFCAVSTAAFGAFIAIFQVAGRGVSDVLPVLGAMRVGAALALGFMGLVLLLVTIGILLDEDGDRPTAYRFGGGAVLGAAALFLLDVAAWDAVAAWAERAEPIA